MLRERLQLVLSVREKTRKWFDIKLKAKNVTQTYLRLKEDRVQHNSHRWTHTLKASLQKQLFPV